MSLEMVGHTFPNTFLMDALSYFSLPDLIRMRRVSKSWNMAVSLLMRGRRTLSLSEFNLSSSYLRAIPLKLDDGSSSEIELYDREIVSEAVQTVVSLCGSNLIELSLEKLFLDSGISAILSDYCPSLQSLKLCKVVLEKDSLPDVDLTALNVSDMYVYACNVVSISLNDDIAKGFVRWINGLSNLKHIEVGQCELRVLKGVNLDNIETLTVSELSGQYKSHLPDLNSSTQEVNLCGVNGVDITSLQRSQSLQKLSLADGSFSNEHFHQVIHTLPALKSLSVKNCRHITSFTCLEALEHLEELQLFGCVVSSASAQTISASCGKIKTLRLASAKMDDSALSHIALPKLRRLSLYNCKSISDKGIEQAIMRSPQLESLSAEWCQGITDALLLILPRFQCLKRLDISFTACTPEGIHALDRLRGSTAHFLKIWIWPIMTFTSTFVSNVKVVNFMTELFPST